MAELEFHDVFWKQANFFWKYFIVCLQLVYFFLKYWHWFLTSLSFVSIILGHITTTITKTKKQRKTQKLSYMYTSHLLCDLFLGCAEGYSKDG